MNRKILENTAFLVFGATLVLFLCMEFLLNLTPPISRDALIHHLAIPKLWLRHGGLYETPWADYSYYPMYINLLYLACLSLQNDIAPKFIHLAFGLFTGGLVYIYLKEKLDRNWGLLGATIFLTTPIVVWLSTSAYVDLGMTFFTTGSILAFVKWRDSEYKSFIWLLISSICMGIAMGSKYNSLIAGMFLNLALMYSYSRDTKGQVGALKYGIIFFLVAALVASPWYVKNYFQTENPFYPMFYSFFKSLHHQPLQEAIQRQVSIKTVQVGFFQMREILYGETFWETLLIPVRMFFQGEDNSYRYFQGVLNPILIVFSPFIILNKTHVRDKLLFAVFSVFFIAMAFFLTEKQVRYILPVLPFLSILAVMGIKAISDRLEEKSSSPFKTQKAVITITKCMLFSMVVVLLSLNVLYLKKRMEIIQPFPYVFRQETRDAFLQRHLLHYAAVKYINTNLPDNVKILTIFLGRRGYYLDRLYRNDSSFGRNVIRNMISHSASEEEFKAFLRGMDFTHILMRTDLVDDFVKNNFATDEIERFMNLVNKNWKLVFRQNGYAVWDIQA